MGMIRFKAATRCWVGCSCNERTAKRADTRASLVGGGLSKPTLPGGSLLVHARPTLTPTSTYAALSGIAVHPACLCRPAIDGRPYPLRASRFLPILLPDPVADAFTSAPCPRLAARVASSESLLAPPGVHPAMRTLLGLAAL